MKITCGLRKALLGSTHCFANHTKVLPQQLSPECLSLKTNYCLRWHVNRKGTLHAVLELEAVLTVCWSRQQLWVQLHREYSNAAVENSLIAMGDFRLRYICRTDCPKDRLPKTCIQSSYTEKWWNLGVFKKICDRGNARFFLRSDRTVAQMAFFSFQQNIWLNIKCFKKSMCLAWSA